MSQLLSIEQAAKRLGVSERTLLRWRNEGSGPRYIKYGEATSPVRYRASDVDEFIQKSTIDPQGSKDVN